MKRREFIAATGIASGALMSQHKLASAQYSPRMGKDYRLIKPVQRTQAPAGKIEVVEFFWVGCPHCRAFEPTILNWENKMPDDVFFRKVHVNFRIPSHQQLYYTLVALKEDKRLIDTVFAEIHDRRNRLNSAERVFDFAEKNGIDREKFVSAYKSFGVRTNMRKAEQEVAGAGASSVPSLSVNGKYYTAPSMAGSNQAVLQVIDSLIDKERKGIS
jgi:thiol:disulfide interchange protein DsbA